VVETELLIVLELRVTYRFATVYISRIFMSLQNIFASHNFCKWGCKISRLSAIENL
jgi:hypothetical protein